MTPPEVFQSFLRLTGGKHVGEAPYDVGQQCTAFVQLGFTLADLELAVAYTRRMIREGENQRNGYAAGSLQWRNLIGASGDMTLQRFQERLALARKAKEGQRQRMEASGVRCDRNGHEYRPIREKDREEIMAGLAALKESLLGLSDAEVAQLKLANATPLALEDR